MDIAIDIVEIDGIDLVGSLFFCELVIFDMLGNGLNQKRHLLKRDDVFILDSAEGVAGIDGHS